MWIQVLALDRLIGLLVLNMSTDYSVLVDAQEAGNVMGSAGSSSGGYRDVRAWFAEFRLPVTDDELNLAPC